MPKLKTRKIHKCIVCESSFKRRSVLKEHLTLSGRHGKPRCPGLKTLISGDVWARELFPYELM